MRRHGPQTGAISKAIAAVMIAIIVLVAHVISFTAIFEALILWGTGCRKPLPKASLTFRNLSCPPLQKVHATYSFYCSPWAIFLNNSLDRSTWTI